MLDRCQRGKPLTDMHLSRIDRRRDTRSATTILALQGCLRTTHHWLEDQSSMPLLPYNTQVRLWEGPTRCSCRIVERAVSFRGGSFREPRASKQPQRNSPARCDYGSTVVARFEHVVTQAACTRLRRERRHVMASVVARRLSRHVMVSVAARRLRNRLRWRRFWGGARGRAYVLPLVCVSRASLCLGLPLQQLARRAKRYLNTYVACRLMTRHAWAWTRSKWHDFLLHRWLD